MEMFNATSTLSDSITTSSALRLLLLSDSSVEGNSTSSTGNSVTADGETLFLIITLWIILLCFILAFIQVSCRIVDQTIEGRIAPARSDTLIFHTFAYQKLRRDYIASRVLTKKVKKGNAVKKDHVKNVSEYIVAGSKEDNDTTLENMEAGKKCCHKTSFGYQKSSHSLQRKKSDLILMVVGNDDDDDDDDTTRGDGIKQLQTQYSINENNISADTDEDVWKRPQCPICLNAYQVEEEICWSYNPNCTHVFHKHCIVSWLMEHDQCPMCRCNFLSLPLDESEGNHRHDNNNNNNNRNTTIEGGTNEVVSATSLRTNREYMNIWPRRRYANSSERGIGALLASDPMALSSYVQVLYRMGPMISFGYDFDDDDSNDDDDINNDIWERENQNITTDYGEIHLEYIPPPSAMESRDDSTAVVATQKITTDTRQLAENGESTASTNLRQYTGPKPVTDIESQGNVEKIANGEGEGEGVSGDTKSTLQSETFQNQCTSHRRYLRNEPVIQSIDDVREWIRQHDAEGNNNKKESSDGINSLPKDDHNSMMDDCNNEEEIIIQSLEDLYRFVQNVGDDRNESQQVIPFSISTLVSNKDNDDDNGSNTANDTKTSIHSC